MMDTSLAKPVTDLASGHTVCRYDQELATLHGIILEMGGRVVEQTQTAAAALLTQEAGQALGGLDRESQIDSLSLDADEEVFQVIMRGGQPAAIDLRIVLALSKIAGEVDRAGDKAVRIARQAFELQGPSTASEPLSDSLKETLRQLDGQACSLFERSIQAIAGFDVVLALSIFEDEPSIHETSNAVRKLLGEQDREGLTPRQVVCLLTCAHALERIGHHAANIAEQVVYVALGQDVRYRNREILIEILRHCDDY
jgi:phosphate transport system protein